MHRKNQVAQYKLDIENKKNRIRHFKESYITETIKEIGLRRTLKQTYCCFDY